MHILKSCVSNYITCSIFSYTTATLIRQIAPHGCAIVLHRTCVSISGGPGRAHSIQCNVFMVVFFQAKTWKTRTMASSRLLPNQVAFHQRAKHRPYIHAVRCYVYWHSNSRAFRIEIDHFFKEYLECPIYEKVRSVISHSWNFR